MPEPAVSEVPPHHELSVRAAPRPFYPGGETEARKIVEDVQITHLEVRESHREYNSFRTQFWRAPETIRISPAKTNSRPV